MAIITARGIELLRENPHELTVEDLKRYPEFVEFITPTEGSNRRRDKSSTESSTIDPSERTQEEILEDAYERIRARLYDELLETIRSCSPTFFEGLVIDLLIAMGYGGSRADVVQALGKSGDEGIDGIVKHDRLGLDCIYVQAKRYDQDRAVGREEVQSFAGALQGKQASKGVFFTTSRFTEGARKYAKAIGNRIVLIDGNQLAALMVENNIGVSTVATYELKRIDNDYFEQE